MKKLNISIRFYLQATSLCHYFCTAQRPRDPNRYLNNLQVTAPCGYTYVGSYSTTPDVRVFRGIPYAEPPLGGRRFRASVIKEDGSETVDTTSNPPGCLQISWEGTSEDCLFLNLWTPSNATEAGVLRPVMVYIHGGGFYLGDASDSRWDGTKFAESGIIFVSVQFRNHWLGNMDLRPIFGVVQEDPNLGLGDQQTALRWIQRNIMAFGGDPNQVTISGWSSGGTYIMAHLASAQSRGLFHRAIVQSGSHVIHGTSAVIFSELLLRRVILPVEREYKCQAAEMDNETKDECSPDNLVDLISAVPLLKKADMDWWVYQAPPEALWDVIDRSFEVFARTGQLLYSPGSSLEDIPSKVLERWKQNDEPLPDLLIGTTMDEGYRLDVVLPQVSGVDATIDGCGSWDSPWQELKTPTLLAIDKIREDASGTDVPGRREGWTREQAAFSVRDEIIFRIPAHHLARAHSSHNHGNTYAYLVELPVDSTYLSCRGTGSPHGIENPSILRNFPNVYDLPHMHDTWVRFASTGNPNSDSLGTMWRAFDKDEGYTHIFSSNGDRHCIDCFGPERRTIEWLLLFECIYSGVIFRPVCPYNPLLSVFLDLLWLPIKGLESAMDLFNQLMFLF